MLDHVTCLNAVPVSKEKITSMFLSRIHNALHLDWVTSRTALDGTHRDTDNDMALAAWSDAYLHVR